MEPSVAYHAQTDIQSEILNEEIIQFARSGKVEGNKWFSEIPGIQLRLNYAYNAYRRNNPFLTLLGFDAKLELDTSPYPINKYLTATLRDYAISQALPNTNASQAKVAKLPHTREPQHKVGDKVL